MPPEENMTDDLVKSFLSNHQKWVNKYKKDKIVDFIAHMKIFGSYTVWNLLKQMHNESTSAKQEIFCFCASDNCNKNEFLPKVQEYIDQTGGNSTLLASSALIFISLLSKYI